MSKDILRNQPNPSENEFRLTRRGKVALVIGGLGLTAAALFGYNQNDAPKYSKETVTEMVEPGDTLWDIAQRVDGANQHDNRDVVDHIKQMPENAETFADGKLDQGEDVTRPVSVE